MCETHPRFLRFYPNGALTKGNTTPFSRLQPLTSRSRQQSGAAESCTLVRALHLNIESKGLALGLLPSPCTSVLLGALQQVQGWGTQNQMQENAASRTVSPGQLGECQLVTSTSLSKTCLSFSLLN